MQHLTDLGAIVPMDASVERRGSAQLPQQTTATTATPTWAPHSSSNFSPTSMDPQFRMETWQAQRPTEAMNANMMMNGLNTNLSPTFHQSHGFTSMVPEAVLESPTHFQPSYEMGGEPTGAPFQYVDGAPAPPRTQRTPRQRLRGRLRKSSSSSRNDCYFPNPTIHHIPASQLLPGSSPPPPAAITSPPPPPAPTAPPAPAAGATASISDARFHQTHAAAPPPTHAAAGTAEADAAGSRAGGGGAEAPDHQEQQYPIRASVQARALGMPQADPMLEDLTQVGAHLPGSLAPILQHKEPLDPAATGDAARPGDAAGQEQQQKQPSSIYRGESSLVNHCRGVTGIGGALVPSNGRKAPVLPSFNKLEVKVPAAGDVSSGPNQSPSQTSAPPRSAGPMPRPKQPPTPTSAVKKEPEESGFKTTFQFVVNESTKDARNTVRKHVMREYRRRERWEQERRRTSGDLPESEEPGATTQKRRRKSNKTPPSATEPLSSLETDATKGLRELYSSGGSGSSSPLQDSSKRRRLGSDLSPAMASKELAAVIPNFEEALEELEKNRDLPYMADPYAEVAASHVDPFSRMQMELGPATRSLMHHFAWVMPSLMDEIVTGTVFNRLGWLYSAVAVHDPKPAHVILGFTLGHIAGLRGQPEPPIATDHKSRAFQLIQDRMADPAQAMSDDNIGAVVNVAGWELIDCNPQHFSVHMDGLHKMVVGRGGLHALAHKPELQTVLVRLDAIRAYTTLSAPRYPSHACFRTLRPLAINIPASADNPAVYPLAPEHPAYAFCEDAFYLLHALEDVLLLLRTMSREHTGTTFPASVRELAHASVQQCLAPEHVLPSSFSRSRSRRAIRCAALVFVDAAIQHFFDGDAPDSGAKRLAARFLGRDKNDMAAWGRSCEMVIHVLLAADRLSLERPWRAWYFADALTLTMKLGEDAWAAVEDQLRAYLTERCAESETLVGPRSTGLWNLPHATATFDAAWAGWSSTASSSSQSQSQSQTQTG